MTRSAIAALAVAASAALVCACGSAPPHAAAAARAHAAARAGAAPRPRADAGLSDKQAAAEAAKAEAIADTINADAGAIHRCWAKAAAADLHVEGKVVLSVEIAGSGKTGSVKVVSDGPKNPILTRCLVALWKRQRWPAVFEGGDQVQLPPLDFVAPDAQYTVRAADVAPVTRPNRFGFEKRLLTAKNTGNGAAEMELFEVRDGTQISFGRARATTILYVLSGGGVMMPGACAGGAREKKCHGTSVAAGSAVYVPRGVGAAFADRKNGHRSRLLQLLAPARPWKLPPGARAAATPPPIHARPGARRRVRSAAGAKAIAIAGGTGQVKVLFDKRTAHHTAASISLLTARPGVALPLRRVRSSVYLFISSGAGQLSVAGKRMAVGAGTAIQVPAGVRHSLRVTGKSPLDAVLFYAPAGPERRLPTGGRHR